MALTTQFATGGKLLASELNSLIKGMRGHIGGLVISNGSGASHDIDLTVGSCMDSTGAHLLILTAAVTKRIDAAWAAGDDAGGLFSGSVAVDTWYHFFLIGRTDGTIDAGFDTSVSAANIPSGYTLYRRIGSVRTDGSANIIGFSQFGDEFLLKAVQQDFSDSDPGTGVQTITLDFVPTDINVFAILTIHLQDVAPAASPRLIVWSPDQSDHAASAAIHDLIVRNTSGGGVAHSNTRMLVRTNTSAQFKYDLDASDTEIKVEGVVHGWIDLRGKDD